MYLILLNSVAIWQYHLKLKIIHTLWLCTAKNVPYRYNSICLPRLTYKDVNRNTIHISKTLKSSVVTGEYMLSCVPLFCSEWERTVSGEPIHALNPYSSIYCLCTLYRYLLSCASVFSVVKWEQGHIFVSESQQETSWIFNRVFKESLIERTIF